jgi:hypothetical protein
MEVLMGTSSINGQFSMAMLNNQRVIPKKTKQLSESEYSFPMFSQKNP